ncbi:HD domain containing protein [Tritrichomonas foetus]|uniref:HD domain containing protein n=1 Tax=Tritrichomonas foetus TaxID=1144522 RepID=A0A1J4JPK8_9EUKA|nr:HD domain containing protein [Tritrichomonas foetus]|eukprot:OHS99451.1 HD domain containing protein [Tritrichomonas foetus]
MNFSEIESFVQQRLGGDNSGHDAFHCYRMKTTALKISQNEPSCDQVVVVCASLLHDIPDVKICNDVKQAKTDIINLLIKIQISENQINHIMSIIDSLSFKGAGVDTTMPTIEGKIVQDADRLDAIGAIGVGRCFAYGGHVGHLMHDPNQKPIMHQSEEDYRKMKSTSISHFYEKLLLLKDRMQTETGKKIAEKRHKFLEAFLSQFLDEWDGKDIDEIMSTS